VDKFSKFASVQPISSRAIIDIKTPLLQLVNLFPKIKTLYCYNERSLNSETIKSILTGNFEISIANSPPLHSTSNGTVERFHSTLAEIARSLKIDRKLDDTIDIVLLETIEYNKTIHSVTGKKPDEIIYSTPNELEIEIKERIQKAKKKKTGFPKVFR